MQLCALRPLLLGAPGSRFSRSHDVAFAAVVFAATFVAYAAGCSPSTAAGV